jgi:hypothetical protein
MIPIEFYKIVKDFLHDLKTTFPELVLVECLDSIYKGETEQVQQQYQVVFDHLLKALPSHFFDILYEKEPMFEQECMLLPSMDFKLLWTKNVTDTTRKTIWKYLQLLLMTVVGNLKEDSFGDAAKVFESMKGDELKDKLQETLKNIGTFFESSKPEFTAESMNDHLKGMLDGKIGKLAKEIADETIGEINGSPEELMKDMMKDPKKLFGLVHSVGDKIDKKIKNGDMKESELIQEATDLLKKMKDIPGMGNMEELMKSMMGGKPDMKAMQNHLNQNMKSAKTKERMQKKLNKRKAAKAANVVQAVESLLKK